MASAQTWVTGDVFAGVGNGQYNVYSNTGTFKQTLTDTSNSGYTTGCAFTTDKAASKLYTTNFSTDLVEVYDATGTTHSLLKTIDTSSAGSSNESLVFDKSGNWYVGHADGAHGVIKYSSADAVLATYFPEVEDRGTDWLDLAVDQKTLYYTSEGLHVKRFDVSTDTQLTDFAGPLPGSNAYAHRLLPPFDGSGGLLVADTSAIYRLDKTGSVVQTYTVSGAGAWFSLNLDPNGTSFWAGDLSTNLLYRFNIASGAVEVGPIATIAKNGTQLAGVCVRGEITSVDTTPPVVVLDKIVAGPPKQVILSTHDTQSGLGSLQVLKCTNCTAVNGSFTIGTNSDVLTTATKTNQSESSVIQLKATDVAGNVTIFDPVDFAIDGRGRQSVHNVEISPQESILLIANGTPGINRLEISVNGRRLPTIDLRNGEGRTVDLSRYLIPVAQNRVTFEAHGGFGATSWIVITQP